MTTPTKQSNDKIVEILATLSNFHFNPTANPTMAQVYGRATAQLNLLLQAERKEGMKQNTGSIKRKLLEARLDELERTQQAIFKNLEIFRHTRKRIKELNHRLDKQEQRQINKSNHIYSVF